MELLDGRGLELRGGRDALCSRRRLRLCGPALLCRLCGGMESGGGSVGKGGCDTADGKDGRGDKGDGDVEVGIATGVSPLPFLQALSLSLFLAAVALVWQWRCACVCAIGSGDHVQRQRGCTRRAVRKEERPRRGGEQWSLFIRTRAQKGRQRSRGGRSQQCVALVAGRACGKSRPVEPGEGGGGVSSSSRLRCTIVGGPAPRGPLERGAAPWQRP